MTLEEYYKKTFTSYYMQFDNSGSFKYGHGICPSGVISDSEKHLKDYLKTHSRKHGIYCEVIYNNNVNKIARIYFITKKDFNKIHMGF